jgi:CHASE2 domain-containing sensor protein
VQPAGRGCGRYLEPAGKETMNGKENPIELLVICAVMLVLSILGIVGGLTPRLRGSLDGLLIVAICLMTALIFAILLFVLAKERGWIGKRNPDGAATVPPSPAK